MQDSAGRFIELLPLRNRERVFRDRTHAGEVLAGMLEAFRGAAATVLAIPCGGVPVAAEIARRLHLPLDVAVVSKITFPWNTESGYGAVAFDGTVLLNQPLVAAAGLDPATVTRGIAVTRDKVARRVEYLRGQAPAPELAGRTAILVDDGLASGFTLRTAIEALRGAGPGTIVVAVPTAHAESAGEIAGLVTALYCPNVRQSRSYAVADAYQRWYDVPEQEALEALQSCRGPSSRAPSARAGS
jgi:predicted phosphoribosyltransferase